MKKTQYEKFLELLGEIELPVSEIALYLQIARKNLYPEIYRAERAGLRFKKTWAGKYLYSICLEPESWQKLKSHHVRICMASGLEKWGIDPDFVCQGKLNSAD